MGPGTVYMYYSRGGDSLNFSCAGKGNAVLIKSGLPYPPASTCGDLLATMHKRNPLGADGKRRPDHKLCSGQTLLCRSLGLRVPDWDQKIPDQQSFQLLDMSEKPVRIVQTTRLGIPPGRDEHLPYRFIHMDHLRSCTQNPLNRRKARENVSYWILENS